MSKRLKNFIKNPDSLLFDELFSSLENYKNTHVAKFNESIDVSFKLGVDGKRTEQNIKSFVDLPHGNGKKIKVIVFASGDDVSLALKLGAVKAGADDLISEIEKGFIDFDKCLATPAMMPKLAKVAKILGPKGLMPSVKTGTVSDKIDTLLQSVLGGRVQFASDKDSFVKMSIGKIDFKKEIVFDNLKEVYLSLKNLKSEAIKGSFFHSCTISTSMGFVANLKLSELYVY